MADTINSVQEFTAKLSIIDSKLGLSRVMGNIDLYKSLLKKFISRYFDFMNNFQKAINERDKDTAARLVHTLKGVAGTIGATSLQTAAIELEKAGGHPGQDGQPTEGTVDDYPEDLVRNLSEELKLAIDELNVAFGDTNTEQPSTNQVSSKKGELIKNLRQFLKSGDSESCDYVKKLVETNVFSNKEALVQLQSYINDYEFDKALSVLDKLD